jgi:predicted amidohydrolase
VGLFLYLGFSITLEILQNTIQLALIQSDLVWNNPIANRIYFDRQIKKLTEVDIIILPELFTTAFCMEGTPEQMDGETIKWMSSKAKESSAAICGSLIILENGKRHNRFVWVSPNGQIAYYDKRHLFSLLKEESFFTAGTHRKIISYKGWKIFPQICYDLRFPVFSRNDEGYDLLLYVANWPSRRIEAWDKLLQARAIENQSYVAGVNRVGLDANKVSFPGHSAVYDALGQTVSYSADKASILTAELSKDKLMSYRSKLPFLKDQDKFTLSS